MSASVYQYPYESNLETLQQHQFLNEKWFERKNLKIVAGTTVGQGFHPTIINRMTFKRKSFSAKARASFDRSF